ncbi:uncharacterized protein LOC114474586 [Gouania willdenowi]|uniref:uncharacterized protein LOC114474586 n=1 Tax=Gouania willdenowi TaxID=441366 RepID=UPI0010553AAE|nr:uncharacterized protein LOC114474586 [Gouania willdenowi]
MNVTEIPANATSQKPLTMIIKCPVTWRSDRIWVLILSVCVISCAYPMIDHAITERDPAIFGFSTPVNCNLVALNSSPVQTLYRAACNIVFFTVVAIIILYTYVRILLETRKMRQDGESVNKAMYTVLLHGLQLLLCMLAFTYPITETLIVLRKDWNPWDIAYINYFCFILMPRFLSPLIYGFRDQALRRHIQNSFLCCFKKRVQPCVRIKMQKNLLVSQKILRPRGADKEQSPRRARAFVPPSSSLLMVLFPHTRDNIPYRRCKEGEMTRSRPDQLFLTHHTREQDDSDDSSEEDCSDRTNKIDCSRFFPCNEVVSGSVRTRRLQRARYCPGGAELTGLGPR